MKITKKLLSLSVAATIATIHAYAVDYIVKGMIDGLDGKMMYMHDYDKQVNIDSALVSDGKFRFEGTYHRPAFVRIENGRNFSNCILDTLAIVDFDTHIPSSGSGLNQRLINLNNEEKIIDDELGKFVKELESHGFKQPELGDTLKLLYNKLRPQRISLYTDAIINNPNGVGEAAILKLGNMWGLLPDEWDAAYATMPPVLKEQRTTRYFNNMYTNIRKSQPGQPFIDFDAKNAEGKTVKFSDYVGKGKYVLVDFWASWCGPCREEAENTLRPLYEKYKDNERFMILGVATWDNIDKTIAALNTLRYPWPQILDAGETPMKLYGFNGIPMIILIDPDGKIIARELRGEKITLTVDSILSSPR